MTAPLTTGHVFGKVHQVRDDRVVLTHGHRTGSFIHVFFPPGIEPGEKDTLHQAHSLGQSRRLTVEKDEAGKLWLKRYVALRETKPVGHNGRRKR